MSGASSSDGYFYVISGVVCANTVLDINRRLFVCLPPTDPCWNVICQSNEVCIEGICFAPLNLLHYQ